jgi:uncharacterized protein YneF (UPF0154 family)
MKNRKILAIIIVIIFISVALFLIGGFIYWGIYGKNCRQDLKENSDITYAKIIDVEKNDMTNYSYIVKYIFIVNNDTIEYTTDGGKFIENKYYKVKYSKLDPKCHKLLWSDSSYELSEIEKQEDVYK